MTLAEISEGIKLALFLAGIIRNPEEALLKAIDDFRHTDNTEITEIKESLCKKLECDDINIVPAETSISIEFVGIQNSLDVFAVNIVGFVYKLLDKMKMFIYPFLPEGVDINNTLNNMSVIHNEISNNVTIEFPGRNSMVSLEVKYEVARSIASIEIPIKSEKILSKLRDMRSI